MKYGFGIDLGGTTVKIAYFNEAGKMLEKWEIPQMLLQQAPISFPIPKSLQLRVLFPFPVPKTELYSKKKTVMHPDMYHGFST